MEDKLRKIEKKSMMKRLSKLGYLMPQNRDISYTDVANTIHAMEEGVEFWIPTKDEVREAGRYYLHSDAIKQRTGNWAKRSEIPARAALKMLSALAYSKTGRHFFLAERKTLNRLYVGVCLSVLSLATHDRLFFKAVAVPTDNIGAVRNVGSRAYEDHCSRSTEGIAAGVAVYGVGVLTYESDVRDTNDEINITATQLKDGVEAMIAIEENPDIRSGWKAEEDYIKQALSGGLSLTPKQRIEDMITDKSLLPAGGLKYSFEVDLNTTNISEKIMSELNSDRARMYNPILMQADVQNAPEIKSRSFIQGVVEFGKLARDRKRKGELVSIKEQEAFISKTGATYAMNGDLMFRNGDLALQADRMEQPQYFMAKSQTVLPDADRKVDSSFSRANMESAKAILEQNTPISESPMYIMEENGPTIYKDTEAKNLANIFYEAVLVDVLEALEGFKDNYEFDLLRGDLLLPTLEKFTRYVSAKVTAVYEGNGQCGASYDTILKKANGMKKELVVAKMLETVAALINSDYGVVLMGKNYARIAFNSCKFWRDEYMDILGGKRATGASRNISHKSLENAIIQYEKLLDSKGILIRLVYCSGSAQEYQECEEFIKRHNIMLAIQGAEIQNKISKASFAGGFKTLREPQVDEDAKRHLDKHQFEYGLCSGKWAEVKKALAVEPRWERYDGQTMVSSLVKYGMAQIRMSSEIDTNLGHMIGVGLMLDAHEEKKLEKADAVAWIKCLFSGDKPSCENLERKMYYADAAEEIDEKIGSWLVGMHTTDTAHRLITVLVQDILDMAEDIVNDRSKLEKGDFTMTAVSKVVLTMMANHSRMAKELIMPKLPSINLTTNGYDYLRLSGMTNMVERNILVMLDSTRLALEDGSLHICN